MSSSFDAVLKQDTPSLAATTIDTLGLEWGTRALRISETRTVKQWIEGTRSVRSATTMLRLRVVAQIIAELKSGLTDTQIQGWFTLPNPELGFESVIGLLEREPIEKVSGQLIELAIRYIQDSRAS